MGRLAPGSRPSPQQPHGRLSAREADAGRPSGRGAFAIRLFLRGLPGQLDLASNARWLPAAATGVTRNAFVENRSRAMNNEIRGFREAFKRQAPLSLVSLSATDCRALTRERRIAVTPFRHQAHPRLRRWNRQGSISPRSGAADCAALRQPHRCPARTLRRSRHYLGASCFGNGASWCMDGIPRYEPVTYVRTGWTVGAGSEAALSRNWFVRIEYRYTDYGYIDYTFFTFPQTIDDVVSSVRLRTQTFLGGIAFKFD